MGYIAILYKVRGGLDSSSAHIDTQHSRSLDGCTEFHKFIRAKLIGFNRLPGEFTPAWALILEPNPIEPIIATEKVATRVANNGVRLLAQRFQHVSAKAALVCLR